MTVYGRNSIREALEQDLTIKEVFIQNGKKEKFEKLIREFRQKDIPFRFVGEKQLDSLSKSRKHQGIAASLLLPQNIIETEREDFEWKPFSLILALDGITNTGNLGAIIRSALLFGADAVVLPNDNSARITPEVIKASAGAIYKETLVYVNNLNRFLQNRTSEGFEIWGLTGEAQEKLGSLKIPDKVVLIIGNERDGLRKSTRKLCSKLLTIPTTRKIDSLNAGVAAAVAMWECRKF